MSETSNISDLTARVEQSFRQKTGQREHFSPHDQFDHRPPGETTAEFVQKQMQEKWDRIKAGRTHNAPQR